MNWAWMTSLDQLWRSPTFPMWLTLAAAGFFGVIVLVTLIRAEKSVANGALTVITLLAIAVAAAATIRGFGSSGRPASEPQIAQSAGASLAALSCIDDLAGETVLAACEKVLFSSAENVAAAVSYAASRLTRLTGYGNVAAADRAMTPDLMALRRAIERDRYGLIAYVLAMRDRCQPRSCAAYQSFTEHNQIAANMDERTYEATVARYAPSWNAPALPMPAWTPPAGAPASVSSLPPSVPSGKPTNADFPTSASIPPVNIMTPEPPLAVPRSAPPAAANPASAAPRPVANSAPTAPKKPAAPKNRPPVQAQTAPVPLAPAPAAADN